MRLKDYDERDGKRVWLSERELQRLLDVLEDDAEQLAAGLLLGRCGLRRNEAVQVTPADVVRTQHGQVLRVWNDVAKMDKYREVPVPSRLTDVLIGLSREADEPIVDRDPSTLYSWVSRAGETLHAETGDEGWLHIGPHDLRRSWGVLVLERGVLPSVVMEWGGWDDWSTFRQHYLAEFSPQALERERGKVDWLAGGVGDTGSDGSNHGLASVDPGSGNQRQYR